MQIDIRWGAANPARSRKYAAELAATAPDVIFASASESTAALREATRTLPIVFVGVTDPVGAGYVASLARPGGNVTGFSFVEFGMGGYSPGHTHPKSAFIYATVLEGEILSQVNDGPVTTYKAGQSFSELPGDHHGVSANASKTNSAKLLAVFVVDTDETELTIPFGN